MLSRAELTAFIAQAILAPSSHNSQPWLFQVGENSIRLLADRTRALPVNDPHDCELSISCGCALMNLRVAGAAAGYGSEVVYHPDPTDEDVLADLAFSGPALDVLACLSKAIPNRRAYRKRFESEELPVDLISELNSVTEAEGARLSVIHDEGQRQLICDLVVKGDPLQWDNPR